MGLTPGDLTVAVQGFGNVGRYVAYFLQAFGLRSSHFRIQQGGIYIPGGVAPIEQVEKMQRAKDFLRDAIASDPFVTSSTRTSQRTDITPEGHSHLAGWYCCSCPPLDTVITQENAPTLKQTLFLKWQTVRPTTEQMNLTETRTSLSCRYSCHAVALLSVILNVPEYPWRKMEQRDVLWKIKKENAQSNRYCLETRQEQQTTMRDAAYIAALRQFERERKVNVYIC